MQVDKIASTPPLTAIINNIIYKWARDDATLGNEYYHTWLIGKTRQIINKLLLIYAILLKFSLRNKLGHAIIPTDDHLLMTVLTDSSRSLSEV